MGKPPEQWVPAHDGSLFHYSSGMQAVMLALGVWDRVRIFRFGNQQKKNIIIILIRMQSFICATMRQNKGWMKADSLSVEYLCGVRSFITFTKANLMSNEFSCPCGKCQNKHGQITSAQVCHHLVSNGIDQSYTNWYFHGEPIENNKANLENHGETCDHPHDVPKMLDLVDHAFGMMRTYNLYVKNPTLPEACITMRYITEEAIMYCMEYMPDGSERSTTTQNSGVTMKAITTFISHKSDPNGVEDETTYYGVVKEILELDYFDFQQTLFNYDWVWIEDKVNGCIIDPETNLIYVNLEKLKRILKEEDEPFVIAFQASQVFYCKDLTRNDYWHVVLDAPKKLTRDVDAYEDPLVYNTQSFLRFGISWRGYG
ncbi:hypothetical protein GIB67_020610 [Kingdonia uniflora]|uniref:Transposase-associated domain-containing protein n=1 Tax=Kingdonia uniflora TaxID=39325 RepID=A0A7J7M964_9MAGN|nr:hypothetical protein GIB67_020610 [Kingdonia uniflora]